ncbi:TetR/AcrR family transcriptional regulator [Streptomyces sp. NPDC002680]|uniref:TetR/AcrR family transcriptional regulator n=1 Tax=Streptomyces sp. NPDC002680 TaxID=3364659 RepID=UPI0036827F4F
MSQINLLVTELPPDDDHLAPYRGIRMIRRTPDPLRLTGSNPSDILNQPIDLSVRPASRRDKRSDMADTMTTGDTRTHIQRVALELFTERGYEKTSLREIAERLGVTKAALYHHFKAKEDILNALFEERMAPLHDVLAWAQDAPAGLAAKQEALRRYATALAQAAPVLAVFRASQAAVRDLPAGVACRETMAHTVALFTEGGASLPDRFRCIAAMLTVHAATLAPDGIEADPEEIRAAALTVALELLAAAHPDREFP